MFHVHVMRILPCFTLSIKLCWSWVNFEYIRISQRGKRWEEAQKYDVIEHNLFLLFLAEEIIVAWVIIQLVQSYTYVGATNAVHIFWIAFKVYQDVFTRSYELSWIWLGFWWQRKRNLETALFKGAIQRICWFCRQGLCSILAYVWWQKCLGLV